MKLFGLVQTSLYRLCRDSRGKHLVKYALMAGIVAVIAGALMPGISTSISVTFSKIGTTMSAVASQG